MTRISVEDSLRGRIYRLLSFRARSRKEIKDYIQRKLARRLTMDPNDKKIIEENLLTYFDEAELINDKEFVSLWTASRNTLSPRSVFLLKRELDAKGIDKTLIDDFFEKTPQNDYELCTRALKKKEKTLIAVRDEEKRFKKGMSFLLRKGFSYSTAKKAFEELFGKKYNRGNL